MTQVIYRYEAKSDLDQIKAFYDDISPDTHERVFADISDTISRLKLFPYSGRRLEGRRERRIVTPKYRYVIVHLISSDIIEIIGIFRYQNR